jgi:hypothetical protein
MGKCPAQGHDSGCAEAEYILGVFLHYVFFRPDKLIRFMEAVGLMELRLTCSSQPHYMILGSTQPLTEVSTKNLPGGNGWLHGADNLSAICLPIV